MSKLRLCIVVRTSMNIHNMYAKRPFGLTKETMVFKCLESLLKSCTFVKDRIFLHIVDDSSPEDIRKRMENLAEKYKIKFKMHRIQVKSNQISLKYSYDLMKKSKEDLVFLADDDYFYTPQAIPFVLNAFDNKIIGTDKFAIYPFDDPSRYEKIYPSFVFLGKDCHWRSIGHSTGSFFILKSLYKKNWNIIQKFIDTLSEKKSINGLWKNIPLISPIPSLVAHLNEDTIPPFVDWEKMLKEYE